MRVLLIDGVRRERYQEIPDGFPEWRIACRANVGSVEPVDLTTPVLVTYAVFRPTGEARDGVPIWRMVTK